MELILLPSITFVEWIKQFKDVPKAIGDLARDIEDDYLSFPLTNDYEKIRSYLSFEKGACYDALRTFDEAWFEYQCFRFKQGGICSICNTETIHEMKVSTGDGRYFVDGNYCKNHRKDVRKLLSKQLELLQDRTL